MSKELIDVVDTAVKIGLGALIGGISSYFMMGKQFYFEKKRSELEARKELMLNLAENFQKVGEGIDRVTLEIRSMTHHPTETKPKFKDLVKDTVDSFKFLDIAKTNSNLLSLDELSGKLEEYTKLLNIFLNVSENYLISGQLGNAQEAIDNITELKNKIYKLIQQGFNTIYS